MTEAVDKGEAHLRERAHQANLLSEQHRISRTEIVTLEIELRLVMRQSAERAEARSMRLHFEKQRSALNI